MRVQATPVELTVSVLAAVVSVMTIVLEFRSLSWIALAVYALLGLGGALAAAGRIVDDLDVEAAGLAALIAALWFVSAVNLGHATSVRQVVGVLLNSGALVVGFGIRLYVVRTATRTRKRAARLIAERRARSE